MHLLGPAFTTTKFTKSKPKKWSSSAAKKKAADLNESWQAVLAKHSPKTIAKKVAPLVAPKMFVDEKRLTKSIPSKDSGGFSTKPVKQVYTGDKIIGIAAMHKSNLVPIFNDAAAKDVATMRRG